MHFPPEDLEPGRCPTCPASRRGAVVARFGQFAYHRCRGCGLWFLDPRPTEAAMIRLYGSTEYFENEQFGRGYQSYERDKPFYQRTFRRRIRSAERFADGRGPVLDVGCGPGYMLEVLDDLGYEPWGLDYAGPALEKARALVGSRAVAVHEAADRVKPAYFASVWLTDVIEHVYDPLAALHRYHVWLRPGGLLVMVTPANNSFLAKVSGRRWVSFKVPEHIYLYGTRSLTRLTDPLFEVLAVERAGQYVCGEFLSTRLEKLCPPLSPLIGAAFRVPLLRRLSLYVTSGSIMYVGRKRAGGVPGASQHFGAPRGSPPE